MALGKLEATMKRYCAVWYWNPGSSDYEEKALPREPGRRPNFTAMTHIFSVSQALAICDSFAITDTMLSAPIALDWVGFNTYDNQGEVMSEEEWNQTVRKA